MRPNKYRSLAERREIIRATIAEASSQKLETFQLTPSEEVFYRARAAKLVDSFAVKSGTFKVYYKLPTARPFGYVIGMSSLIVACAAIAATYLYISHRGETAMYPLFSACATLAVVAIGWAVAGGIVHRNTIRQNTNNLLFARFSQATFGDAMHRFHLAFGNRVSDVVTNEMVTSLRLSDDEEDRKKGASVTYLLNYYEFIASGVLRGDLDQRIIRENIRGMVTYYYDKCEPYIRNSNRNNSKTFEYLIKLRTHYREP